MVAFVAMATIVTDMEVVEIMLGFTDLPVRDQALLEYPQAERNRLEWCKQAIRGKNQEEVVAGVRISRGRWVLDVKSVTVFWLVAETTSERLVLMMHNPLEDVSNHDRPRPDRWIIRMAASTKQTIDRFGVILRLAGE